MDLRVKLDALDYGIYKVYQFLNKYIPNLTLIVFTKPSMEVL